MSKLHTTANTWQPMDTAPRNRTEEILATDYESIEIIHWAPVGHHPAWEDRYGDGYMPSLWQPMPQVPPLTEEVQ